MSSFDIWLWLKLDDIRECVGIMIFLALLAAAIMAIRNALCEAASSANRWQEPIARDWRTVRRIVLA